MAQGLSCSAAGGIFLDQGSNPFPLHWQADSLPLRHQGNPLFSLIDSNLMKCRLPDLCRKNSYIAWLLPYLFRTERLRPGLSPQFYPPNKTDSQLLGRAFFFSGHNYTLIKVFKKKKKDRKFNVPDRSCKFRFRWLDRGGWQSLGGTPESKPGQLRTRAKSLGYTSRDRTIW